MQYEDYKALTREEKIALRKNQSVSMNVGVAMDVGANAAIIFNNINFWYFENMQRGVNFVDGKYWTFDSVKDMVIRFPWLSESQIRTSLKRLEERSYIVSAEHNKLAHDRTKWYTLSDKSLCAQTQMHLRSDSNGLSDKTQVKPRDINTKGNHTKGNKEKDKKVKKLTNKEKLESVFSDYWSSDEFKKVVPSVCRQSSALAFKSMLKVLDLNDEISPDELFRSVLRYYSQPMFLEGRKENKRKDEVDGQFISRLPRMLNAGFYEGFLDDGEFVKKPKGREDSKSNTRFDIALNAWINGGSWDSFSFGPEPNTEKNRKLSKITDEQYKKYLAAKEEKSSSRP